MFSGTIRERINQEVPAIKPTAKGSGDDFRIKNPKLIGNIAITQHIM